MSFLSFNFGSGQFSSKINALAENIGKLAVSIAGVSGNVEDTSDKLSQQAGLLEQIAEGSTQIASQSSSVIDFAKSAYAKTEAAEKAATETSDRLQVTLENASNLAQEVKLLGRDLEVVRASLDKVRTISVEIDSIAQKTNLLSLNAAVEAARAGESGRGFTVVASEFKALSDHTANATIQITDLLAQLTKDTASLAEKSKNSVKVAEELEANTSGVGQAVSEVPKSLRRVSEAQSQIVDATQDIAGAVNGIQHDIREISEGISFSAENVGLARDELSILTGISETAISAFAELGVKSADTPYIEVVTSLAKKISKAFEDGIKDGSLHERELFDREYAPIEGTNPVQYTTGFTRFCDSILPAFQEPMLDFSNKIVFCAVVDDNGYLPTHNAKFSHPQRPTDPEWNAGNSRNRRIFNDKVGLAAGKNKKPFLLQAYRRDMGNDTFALMKDLSAPIVVNGAHWGGVRLAYKVD